VLNGRHVDFRPGWDCHGLPIELKAIKANNNSLDRMAIRARAAKFAQGAMLEQKKEFKSWQLLADWDNYTYSTMMPDYEYRELQVLKELVSKGLVRRQKMPVNWSPLLRTALAESEIEYHDDHVSTAVYVKFPIVSDSHPFGPGLPLHAVIWTTTPWSLMGNTAIAIHPDIEYLTLSTSDSRFIVAAKRANVIVQSLGNGATVSSAPVGGKALLSLIAEHPIDKSKRPFIIGEHVSDDSGTGLVHIAPAHGVEDWEAQPTSEMQCFVNEAGMFENLPNNLGLNGLAVLSEGTSQILKLLSGRLALDPYPYKHRYPYDWRSKTPMLTRAATQWFVSGSDEQANLAGKISRFIPESGERRLRAFLSTRKHGWCLSRQRLF